MSGYTTLPLFFVEVSWNFERLLGLLYLTIRIALFLAFYALTMSVTALRWHPAHQWSHCHCAWQPANRGKRCRTPEPH